MPGPFPGMDPYIETQGNWPDFHNSLVTEIRNALGASLPGDYVARMDERIEVVGLDGPESRSFLPDVLVALGERRDPQGQSAAGGVAVAEDEPMLIDVIDHDLEEVRHTWLEVRRLPDLELITVVEVLSPVNKVGYGRVEYLEKREKLHALKVNLVEIDLLLCGQRLPMKTPLRSGHHFAIVSRGSRLPTAEVYARTVRDRLPTIPIPLRDPDPDVRIDLQELVDRVYDLGRYGRTLHHGVPLPDGIRLHPEDRSWAEHVGTPTRAEGS